MRPKGSKNKKTIEREQAEKKELPSKEQALTEIRESDNQQNQPIIAN